ncbi:hypothetical protein EOL70_09560 [Leucothrix sargassi]|nr:hypothetical protein EOL70_09560 [Leucothrix sargassi]
MSHSLYAQTTPIADQDGDGVPDHFEQAVGSEKMLSDTDGDGISDGLELSYKDNQIFDHDKDGRPNILDEDDDGDGIPTIYEGSGDADNDGIANYLDLDSDNDGISDRDEAGLSLKDADRDRVDDMFDVDFTQGEDENGDGLDDKIALMDANKNGVADFLDKTVRMARTTLLNPVAKAPAQAKVVAASKALNQTQATQAPIASKKPEQAQKVATNKQEHQAAPDEQVAKAKKDKETVSTSNKEAPATKPTKTAKAIQIDDDSDGDGLSNAVELAAGMNPMSRDSDGDGVPDFIEIGNNKDAPQDSDQDGRPDALDTDDDNDGILTKAEDLNKDGQLANDDTDKDGVPNYLDANDDGDARLTKLEGPNTDTDKDGIPDYLDSDDGISGVNKAEVVVLYDSANTQKQEAKETENRFKLMPESTLADSK